MIAPSLVYLALVLLGLGVIATKHGELPTARHNIWTTLIATAISMSILWWGGFFKTLAAQFGL